MTVHEFIQRHTPANVTIKVIWPDRNRIITGARADFAGETKLLKANVFDFQISNGLNGYHCLIWATTDSDALILDL